MKKTRVVLPKDSLLDARKITEISSWTKVNHEWRGTRDKIILRHPNSGHFFLVKFPRYGENEIFYELFNCYFGKSLGLSYADYYLCKYDNELCISSKSFLSVDTVVSELWEMKELICRYASTKNLELKFGRDKDVLREHYIDQIVMILHTEFGEEVLPSFFRMIAFDCLTGHGDRHWENYGVLVLINESTSDISFRFAPIYDTAYGYLLERDDSLVQGLFEDGTLDNKDWFDPKIKGLCKITLEGNVKASHIDLFRYILNNEEFLPYHKYLFEVLRVYDRKVVAKILNTKPFSTGLTQVRKDVILKVLEMRYAILADVVQEYDERMGKVTFKGND